MPPKQVAGPGRCARCAGARAVIVALVVGTLVLTLWPFASINDIVAAYAPVRGVSVAIASYRRAAMLKAYIPRYLDVPIVREVVISDDYNSSDAHELRQWLPISGLSEEQQSRVVIFGDTGGKLGSFRNKVRAISLSRQDWVALIDSDNFASPEHYWAPLVKFWEDTYGSAPPPAGNREAESRSIHPSVWCTTNELLAPPRCNPSMMRVVENCTRTGDLTPPGGLPRDDPLAAIGKGCWESAMSKPTDFVRLYTS
jgi:hypothetical protein